MKTDPTDIVVDLDEAPETAAPGESRPPVDVDEDDTILPRGCERNADGSVTVRLAFPVSITIKSGGAERVEAYDQLTFHRLRGADLAAMRSTAPEHQSMVILSRSSRVPHRVMTVLYAKMDGADIGRCDQVLASFLG